MVKISDILRRGRGEEEPREKKPEEEAGVKKEKVFPRPPEKELEKEKEPQVSQIEISRVIMEKTKIGRPKSEEIYQ